jgi:SAM-dependent methyltransferase
VKPVSPYLAPGVYDRALAAGRHREVTGGWWEETGRLQLDLLRAEGLAPGDRLLDIGCGALRLGRKAVPYLDPGHYWGTDASGPLMQRGWEVELDAAAQARLPRAQLVEDAGFTFPGVPDSIGMAICWGVFTHLPPDRLAMALTALLRFPRLRAVLFTVFLPGPGGGGRPVTHRDRPPYAVSAEAVAAMAAGWQVAFSPDPLPRRQTLCVARPATGSGRPPAAPRR